MPFLGCPAEGASVWEEGLRADPEDTRPEVEAGTEPRLGVNPLSRPRCSEEGNTYYKQGPQLT